jgi:hypothetical protein
VKIPYLSYYMSTLVDKPTRYVGLG